MTNLSTIPTEHLQQVLNREYSLFGDGIANNLHFDELKQIRISIRTIEAELLKRSQPEPEPQTSDPSSPGKRKLKTT